MDIDVQAMVDVERGLLSPEVYFNQDIYQLELERIFGRCWLFLAHESMLKKPGDFVQTYMAQDPVLVTRQRDGSVKVFLNQCRHRGMRICRADLGNTRAFTCSYHGWSYDLAGNLISVPHEEDGYHNELDKSSWGPRHVAQIKNYKGFIFATWDPEAPPFEEYVGDDMLYFFDAFAAHWKNGVEVIGGVHKWVIECNWKFAAEQFASDAYHGETTHASAHNIYWPTLLGKPGGSLEKRNLETGRQFSSVRGHGTGIKPRDVGQHALEVMEWQASQHEEIAGRLDTARADGLRGHTTIFPNFSYLGNGSIRVWHPRGPNQIEVWAWTTVPADAPPEIKASIRKQILRTFSPGGLWEQDDGENWNEIQKVLQGYMARKGSFNIQMGLGHGEQDVNGHPGMTNHHFAEEGTRGFHSHWADLLTSATWQEVHDREDARDKARIEFALRAAERRATS